LPDRVSVGVLARVFPPEVVDAVLLETGRVHQRKRLLPARLVVYYVLALALFAHASYGEVMRQLTEGLVWSSSWRRWSRQSLPVELRWVCSWWSLIAPIWAVVGFRDGLGSSALRLVA
jgi:hypothetical protein